MELKQLSYHFLQRHRNKLLTFIVRFGDQRITSTVLRWLKQLDEEALNAYGTSLLIAIENKKIVGIIGFSQFGIEHSFIVIHPSYRNHGLGKEMLKHQIQRLGKVYSRVALDNYPSMKICFANGLVAFKLFQGPTGKPTLWFGGGHWSKEDVRDEIH